MSDLAQAIALAYHPDLKPAQRYALAHEPLVIDLPTDHPMVRQWTARASQWLAGATADTPRFFVSLRDDDYPIGLKQLKDPPLILFGQGNRALLNCRALAIVGSRNATQSGLETARQWSKTLAARQWCIVSGLAEGIDGAAHRGALEANGSTIAVLGGGIDQIYPKCHHGLADEITARQGLLVSEYPPGTAPQPAFFPRRNRIIAGLSDGLLVVEAALKSGSLITAQQASSLGKPSMAMPGSIHSAQSKGCHQMIKKGALLVETADDIETELKATLEPDRLPAPVLWGSTHNPEVVELKGPSNPQTQASIALDSQEHQVLKALGHEPLHADAVARECGLNAPIVLSVLTTLELEGWVLPESGNRWVLAPGVAF